MRQLQAGAKLREVRRMQVHVTVAAAINIVLDVLDDTVTTVVHDDQHQVGLFLHRAGEFTHIEHQAAVADQGHRLAAQGMRGVGNGHANRHGQPLSYAAAQGVHTGAGVVKRGRPVAPHGVGQGDVAHPPEVAAGCGTEFIFQPEVGAEAGIDQRRRGAAGARYIGVQRGVHLHAPFKTVCQCVEAVQGIAVHKKITLVGPVVRQGIGVNAVNGFGQFEPVAQGLVGAQARTHDQHGVAALVQLFDRFVQVV